MELDKTAGAKNQKALNELANGDFYTAQELFKENALRHPSVMTLNNLGVFYTSEGLVLPNGKTRSAKKLGLTYLKKAEQCAESYINLMAIGDWYFDIKDYSNASDYYEHASCLRIADENTNNFAAASYMQKDYTKAISLFRNLLSCSNFDLKYNAVFGCAFSHIYKGEHAQARELLSGLITVVDPDTLALAYLCGDMPLCEKLVYPVLQSYHTELSILAMAIDCLFAVGKDNEAENLLKTQVERLSGFEYNTKTQIRRLQEIFRDEGIRKTELSAYRYLAPIQKQCCYIGCKIHNTQ